MVTAYRRTARPSVSEGVLKRAPSLAWLDDEAQILGALLSEVPADTLEFARRVISATFATQLLEFLLKHPGVSMTARDLAYYVGASEDALLKALAILTDEGVVITQDIAGSVFYRLTDNAPSLQRATIFCDWWSGWRRRVTRLQSVLHTT
ncbi:MAG: winged helix-turn-helix domain-containing protein [Anaerolineae bacterium]